MHDSDSSADNYNYGYLPESVAVNFRDAIGCYRNGLTQAFATMCRLTMQAVLADLGESARLKLFDQVEEICELADISEAAGRRVRSILFDVDNNSLYQPDAIDPELAGILLETMKDVLHQSYIRRAVLRQKLRMRRFFANQSGEETTGTEHNNPKVSRLRRDI